MYVTTKLSLGGNNDVITELFLPRGSFVGDIPAGDGKLVNLFLRCTAFSFLNMTMAKENCNIVRHSDHTNMLDKMYNLSVERGGAGHCHLCHAHRPQGPPTSQPGALPPLLQRSVHCV
jgi:hypothetical protein